MKNTLFDSNLGDVSSINLPIGQSTPYAGTFTTIAASVVIAGTVLASNLSNPTGTVSVANVTATTVDATNITASTVVANTVTVTGPATVSGNVSVGGYLTELIANVSAGVSTSTFSAAIALTAQINIVTYASGTSAAPVALPSVAVVGPGTVLQVWNKATHTVGVWPQPLDIIDGAAAGSTGVPVALATSGASFFVAASTTGWVSAVMGTVA